MVFCLLLVKRGVYWGSNLKWKLIFCGDPISEYDFSNESAVFARLIHYSYIATINRGVFIPLVRRVSASDPEQG